MKSRFFTDTQALDAAPAADGRVHVCLLMSQSAVEMLLQQAAARGLPSGDYLEQLLLTAGTTKPLSPYSPPRRSPPAPPGH